MKLFVMYCSKSSIDPVLSGKYPHNIITHNAGNVYTRSENKKSRFCGREIPFSSGIRNTVTDPAGSVFPPFRVCFFRTFSLFGHCRRTYTSVSYDFLTVIAFLAVLAAVCAVSAAETAVCFCSGAAVAGAACDILKFIRSDFFVIVDLSVKKSL